MQLHVVMMGVEGRTQRLKPPLLGRALSRLARKALRESAKRSGFRLGALRKNAAGAPLPSRGVHWSVSHKREFVCAVVCRSPVGVDVEEIRPHPRALFARIAAPAEWKAMGRRDATAFARLFSAKEAVLKAEGIGIKGLRACVLVESGKEGRLTLQLGRKRWQVTQIRLQDHVVSIARRSQGVIVWHLII